MQLPHYIYIIQNNTKNTKSGKKNLAVRFQVKPAVNESWLAGGEVQAFGPHHYLFRKPLSTQKKLTTEKNALESVISLEDTEKNVT